MKLIILSDILPTKYQSVNATNQTKSLLFIKYLHGLQDVILDYITIQILAMIGLNCKQR